MRRLAAAIVAASSLALVACGPSLDAGPGAELASAFAFSAYPNGTFVSESVYPTSMGPFAMPGKSGYRVYQTNDSPATVKAHYENLGKTHQWLVNSQSGDPGYAPNLATVNMSRDGFYIDVNVTTEPMVQGHGPYARPIPPPSPSPSPGESPTPAPTPTGPFYVQVNVNVQ